MHLRRDTASVDSGLAGMDLSPKAKGTISELRVASELEARGFMVSQPFGERGAYDLIADHAGRLMRIQVKSTHAPRSRDAERQTAKTIYQINAEAGFGRYDETLVDFLIGVVWLPNGLQFLIIPASFLNDTRTLLYSPDDTRWGCGMFADAWDLLTLQPPTRSRRSPKKVGVSETTPAHFPSLHPSRDSVSTASSNCGV